MNEYIKKNDEYKKNHGGKSEIEVAMENFSNRIEQERLEIERQQQIQIQQQNQIRQSMEQYKVIFSTKIDTFLETKQDIGKEINVISIVEKQKILFNYLTLQVAHINLQKKYDELLNGVNKIGEGDKKLNDTEAESHN